MTTKQIQYTITISSMVYIALIGCIIIPMILNSILGLFIFLGTLSYLGIQFIEFTNMILFGEYSDRSKYWYKNGIKYTQGE